MRRNSSYFQYPCNLERIYCEHYDKDYGEYSGYFEQIGGGWVFGVVVSEDYAMGNLVLLEIAEIYAEDPYVEYENADSSPQDEILIENSVRIECD